MGRLVLRNNVIYITWTRIQQKYWKYIYYEFIEPYRKLFKQI